jgi:quinoprotein glucose dehydrogenase
VPKAGGGRRIGSAGRPVRGQPNVWAGITYDPEFDCVTCRPGATSENYGGDRLGDNLFTETLVCQARTGKRVWHFQTDHHGLWDYDIPAPMLADIA